MLPTDYVQGTCVHDTCNQSHIPLATFRLHQSEVSSPSPLFLPSLSPLFLYLHSVLLPASFDPHFFSLSNICIAAFLPHLFISTCIHVYTITPLRLVPSLSVTYQQPIYPPFSLLFSLHFLLYCVHYTVEPQIRDPLRYGRPLYKGHLLFQPHANTLVYYLTSEIGTTSLQNRWPHSVPCLEVPLYLLNTPGSSTDSNISTDHMLYSEKDLEKSMDKIETVNFHQV